LTATETVGATAIGSAAAAGIESAVTGKSFMDIFNRNFGISATFLGAGAIAALAGDGVVKFGANSLLQGYVQSSECSLGCNAGLTIWSASSVSGGAAADLLAHELGHTLQFIGLSAFGNPWPPYLVLGSWGFWGGTSVPGVIWEGIADALGGAVR
jgi:hypothetical protein